MTSSLTTATIERIGAENQFDAAEAGWRRVATEGSLLMTTLRLLDTNTPAEGPICAL